MVAGCRPRRIAGKVGEQEGDELAFSLRDGLAAGRARRLTGEQIAAAIDAIPERGRGAFPLSALQVRDDLALMDRIDRHA